MTLSEARAILDGALADARARGARPLAVIVLDAGAHPVAFAREDGATFGRIEIARAKAAGSLAMEADSRVLAQRAKENPAFFQGLPAVFGGSMAFSPGGVLVHRAGRVIGAVGISGDAGEVDEACALAGMAAAGLGREIAA